MSTGRQAEQGESIPQQRAAIAAYARASGASVATTLVDHVSASVPILSRPSGAQLPHWQGACLVTTRLDRMFRDVLDCLVFLDQWHAGGGTVVVLDHAGSAIDTETPMGRFLLTALSAAGELERGMTRERVRDVMAHLHATGRVRGNVPYGARRREQYLEPCAAELALCRDAARLRDMGLAWEAVAAALNSRGRRTRTGAPWTASGLRRAVMAGQRYAARLHLQLTPEPEDDAA